MEKWTSQYYEHFKMPPEIVIEKGIVKYKFACLL